MSRLRIGFAGAGFIAGIHASGLIQRRDVEITAVVDPNEGQAGPFANTYGARSVPSFADLLGESDAVYVCAPNRYHAEMAIGALRAGKHVFSEKPMAISPEDARRVRAAAERAKGVYQIGFNKRFAPVYRRMKERIEAGDLVPRWANIKMNRGELQRPPWVADAAITGGFLYETPIHVLELSTWLFGPAHEVFCRARQTCSDQLDAFAMVLTFASGVSATLCSSAHTTWLFPYERVEVYGEHSMATTDEMDRLTVQCGLDAEPETLDVSELAILERWGYAAAHEAFIAATRGERQAAAGAAEGEAAVLLVDACYRAAQSEGPVRLDSRGRAARAPS